MDHPSPLTNPFSAAAVSGGRLPYLFADPSAETELLQALEQRQWIGQIVGPHGSGKTTLSHHLWVQSRVRFPRLVQVTIRGPKNIQRRVAGGSGRCLFVVDGIERLSRVDRWLFLFGFSPFGNRRRAGQGDGLIVTGHRRLPWLPLVFETSFDQVLLDRLAGHLLEVPSPADISDIDGGDFWGQRWTDVSRALLQRHESNAREILMEMYDLYEASTRKKLLSKKSLVLSKAGAEN